MGLPPALTIALAFFFLVVVFVPTKDTTFPIGEAIKAWSVYPGQASERSATVGWLLTNFDDALKICAGYLVLVFVGLTFKDPKGEDGTVSPIVDKLVKALQILYNLAQCGLCGYMFYGAVAHYISHKYVPICNAFVMSETGMATVVHVFYLSKVLDFCDTLFIVLRKKWRQLSFLHTYHHVTIFLFYWLNINVAYDGDVYLTVVLNSFVHLVMYSYYFLATLGYSAWWKNYITLLQMAQFVMMVSQAVYILWFGCPFPRNLTALYLGYIISLLFLFQNFYARTYTKKTPRASSNANKPKAH